MIRALKRKFVLISMLLVFVVLTLVLLGGILATRVQFAGIYHLALQRELATDLRSPNRHAFPVQRPEDNPGGRTPRLSFTVAKDADGAWAITTPWVQVEEDTLQLLNERALQEASPSGFWQDLGIAYQRGQDRIAFVNLQAEYSQQQSMLLVYIAVYAGALLMFFLISLGLSKWALRPVEQSWAQQHQFVSDASHELKTPLTVILANLDIQEQESGQSNWLTAARSEGLHMKKLIESMLFLTRSDEAKQAPSLARMSLSSLVQEAALAFDAVAYENNITLVQEVKEGLQIKGDQALLRQLVSILLDNAIKYTPDGGEVRLSLHQSRDKAVLRVLNAPSYIPPEQLSHIFDRFYRTDESRTRGEGSYGLGLAIASEIARQHGVSLKANSVQGVGTTFSVAFPL